MGLDVVEGLANAILAGDVERDRAKTLRGRLPQLRLSAFRQTSGEDVTSDGVQSPGDTLSEPGVTSGDEDVSVRVTSDRRNAEKMVDNLVDDVQCHAENAQTPSAELNWKASVINSQPHSHESHFDTNRLK